MLALSPALFVVIAFIVVVIAIIIAVAYQSKHGFPSFSTPRTGPVISHGDLGEMAVAQMLGETVFGCRYVINNLTVAFPNGDTFQIDHILIDARGVMVVETKNFIGRIYGQETQQQWMQICGNKKRYFYNPVMQNATHVVKLKRLLAKEIPISSAVVFVRGELDKVFASNVYNIHGFKRVLNMPCAEARLTPETMEEIYQTLIRYKQEQPMHEAIHMQKIQHRNALIARGQCPRCGSPLRVVNGKNGLFYGCSAYPRCNYTHHLNP